ncbi:MAG: hypothetical protein GY786_07525 [Proteobacteria bacterium]|nr:hypothetical protein [Pseudomonadota bacterium]
MLRLFMKKIIFTILLLAFTSSHVICQEKILRDRLFVHMKSGLDNDDAQICVAYNIIWAGLRSGLDVDVLIDADAILTFQRGFFSDSDSIQSYDIPNELRAAIASQFSLSIDEVPRDYGEYLQRLKREGANFYINKSFLILSELAENPDKEMEGLSPYSADIFQPLSLIEMIELRKKSTIDYTF